MKTRLFGLALLVLVSCQRATEVEWVSTTFENPWQVMEAVAADTPAEATVVVDLAAVKQTVEGFGTCFIELGWTSLSVLSEVTPKELAAAVITKDSKLLTKAQGVGAKMAQRIILELADKIKRKNEIKSKF